MNLNVLTNLISNSNGNITGNEEKIQSSEFQTFFNEYKNEVENIGLNSNIIDKDTVEDIGYNLIQSLLSTIQKLGFIKDLESLNSLGLDGKSVQNIDDLLEKIPELKNINFEALKKVDFEGSTKVDFVIDDEFIDFIKNTLNNNENDSKKANIMDSIKNYLDSKINEDTNYKELEVSSLKNKSNLIQNDVTKSQDKYVDTLEDILKSDNTNGFMNFNILNTNDISTNSEDTQVIKEVRREFVSEDVVKTVKYLKSNGLEEISVRISPRELGEVTIKLIKDAGDTKLSIIISKDEVFDLIDKNVEAIKSHLNDLNINVKEVSVETKGDNQMFFSDNLNQEFNKRKQQNQNKKNKREFSELQSVDEIKEDIVEDNLNILI